MKFLLLIIILISTVSAFPQKVDSIKVEQAGDFIKIRYKILNSTPDQFFRVMVLCSINGGLNTELKSVTGDVGDMIPGGKDEYWAVWDVLKDVDELKSAEFIVRAELISKPEAPRSVKKTGEKNFSLMVSGQMPQLSVGGRFSYMAKAGFSVQFLYGKADINPGSQFTGKPNLSRISFDFTKRIANKEKIKLHLLTGISIGQAVIEDHYEGEVTYPVHFVPGAEIGTAFYIGSTAFSITFSRLLVGLTEEGFALSQKNLFTLSLGFRFK
ncbi:MAG: hypothetical protein WBJ37_12255 [Bacteroidales bacterium]